MIDKMNWNYSPTEEEMEMLRNSPKKPRASIKPRDQWNDEDLDKYRRFMTKYAQSKANSHKRANKVDKKPQLHKNKDYLKSIISK